MLFRPAFYRPSLPADREALRELLKRDPALGVHDELLSQLGELVRTLNPSARFTTEEMQEAVRSHLGATPAEEYGVWVYYPWLNKLVHLLDEAEFAQVRTDRNRNKITREEQAVLSGKKVGVIGLSVGQSVCLTLAMERGFGELRIADFDTLDLSNLNRIRSGVRDLGNLKTVNTARAIAELDPYLKVVPWHEGITRDNIDAFINDGGKLDALVDECDSIDVKILARQRARAHRVPVIMDTSDRGMLDVERFDLEPERPILHGLIGEVAADGMLQDPSMRVQLAVRVAGGPGGVSQRMRDSLPLIGRSILTWPQLASAVTHGGATAAETLRRILLGRHTASGRWYVDTERILDAPPALTAAHDSSTETLLAHEPE